MKVKLISFGIALLSSAPEGATGRAQNVKATISSLPKNLTAAHKCYDVRPGENRTKSQRLGCWILANGKSFFGSTDITADLSAPMPKVMNTLYNNEGMANAVRDGCFSLIGTNGEVSINRYKFSSLDSYISSVRDSTNIDVSGKVGYLLSSVSASYTSSQINSKEVASEFSYSKAHVRAEIEFGKVQNNCFGNDMQKYVSRDAMALWEQVKADPSDMGAVRAFNDQFRVFHPDEWTIGGVRTFELTATIYSDSVFDSDAMTQAISAAANVQYGPVSAEVTSSMEKSFNSQVNKTSMKTSTQSSQSGVWPCNGGPDLLSNFSKLSTAEIARQTTICRKEFEDDFESWSPYKITGYSSTIDLVMNATDRSENKNLQKELAVALHDENVKCSPVKVRGFRIVRNSTASSGKSYVYSLGNCLSTINGYAPSNCRFEQGKASLMFERVTGVYGRHGYLIHNITDPNYTGNATGILAVSKDGHVYGDRYWRYGNVWQNFGYEAARKAFTFTAFSWSQALNVFPNSTFTRDPLIGRDTATYLLNSDATFVGTNTTNPDILNQKDELLHVNGIRASLDGKDIDLCEPTDKTAA
mmetsp:Transcript_16462/g.35922  ORF Transcript_16462/g.35922 Transcript_16462/m.35922 type:complete len:585 (-) Transcript_16462:107-1861(-)